MLVLNIAYAITHQYDVILFFRILPALTHAVFFAIALVVAANVVPPDPVDVRLSSLESKVDQVAEDFAGVSDLVNQLAKLAGDLQTVAVKAGA